MEKLQNKIAEISVSYNPTISNKPIVVDDKDAYPLFFEALSKDTMHLQESFFVMYLNQAHSVLGIYPLSKGGINSTVVDVRLVLSVALKVAATKMIIAHNHPSGSLRPSEYDINATYKIKQSASIMDITLLDHLLLSPIENEFFSFARNGLI